VAYAPAVSFVPGPGGLLLRGFSPPLGCEVKPGTTGGGGAAGIYGLSSNVSFSCVVFFPSFSP